MIVVQSIEQHLLRFMNFCCSINWTSPFFLLRFLLIERLLFNQLNNTFCDFLILLFNRLNDFRSIHWTMLLRFFPFSILLFNQLNNAFVFFSFRFCFQLIEQHFVSFYFQFSCSNDWTIFVQSIEQLLFNQLNNILAFLRFCCSIDWTIVVQSIKQQFLHFCVIVQLIEQHFFWVNDVQSIE